MRRRRAKAAVAMLGKLKDEDLVEGFMAILKAHEIDTLNIIIKEMNHG